MTSRPACSTQSSAVAGSAKVQGRVVPPERLDTSSISAIGRATLPTPPHSTRTNPPGRTSRAIWRYTSGCWSAGTQCKVARLSTPSNVPSCSGPKAAARSWSGERTNDWLAAARSSASAIIDGWASTPTT